MPSLDTDAVAQLDSGDPSKPIFLIYLDVDGDPIRAVTAGYPITLPTLDDPDLSGQTFLRSAFAITVGDIVNRDDGSDTVQIDLSGQLLPDADLLDAIGDRSKWQGRAVRVWVLLRDETRTQTGAIAEFYTGYMSAVSVLPSAKTQIVRLSVEGYRALLAQGSNRSYLDAAYFDAADTSAGATIGAANGAKTGPGSTVGTGGLVSGGSVDGGGVPIDQHRFDDTNVSFLGGI